MANPGDNTTHDGRRRRSDLICGTAADVAHAMTTSMTKYLGIEAVVDAMMYHQGNETVQENGAAVIANVASVDLGAKRVHEVSTARASPTPRRRATSSMP